MKQRLVRMLVLCGTLAALAVAVILITGYRTELSFGKPVATESEDARAKAEIAVDASNLSPPASVRTNADGGFALPKLQIDPENYAHLTENPYRCGISVSRESPCDWRFDPMIARSPAEARWMSAYGYPTTDQRELAVRTTTAALFAEAKRTGSSALWALALQRAVDEAETASDAESHARMLRRVASQGRNLFALEQAALASLHVADLILADAADPSVRDRQTGGVETLMSLALKDVSMVAALGDPGAMIRVLQKAPAAVPDIYGKPLNAVAPAYAAEKIQEAYIVLRRNQALADRGALLTRDFTVADIAPRPTPVLEHRRIEGDVWTGER